jgi:putative transposase
VKSLSRNYCNRCPGITGNGVPEFAKPAHGVAIQHIQLGQPQQNAYIERYNRTVRHEWLDQYIIESIEEAQDHATQWLWTYNNDRPNMGIGGITPAQKLKMAA